ncbi:unnamed protein product [Ilex paraguariensis]|uniref:Gnk2-homologous domain-containing protein n=2 Tax=Ilex paraguariensis TaxID=185542 RepID=A0ABC8U414_9AQUA
MPLPARTVSLAPGKILSGYAHQINQQLYDKLHTANSIPLPNSNQVRYGMVQCARHISKTACGDSLNQLGMAIQQGQVGWRILGASCFIRYEEFSFALQSSAAQPAPPPSPTTVPPTKQGESNRLSDEDHTGIG